MADKYRFRSGQMQLRTYGVASATVIERSDMLWIDSTNNEVKNAAAKDFNNDLDTTQQEFADLFVGIAYEASASGDTDDISVDVSADSVYEFDVTSSTYNMGDDLGAADGDSPSTALDDQRLEAPATSNTGAVARAAEKAESAVTLLRVQFASIHNVSGNNANAGVG